MNFEAAITKCETRINDLRSDNERLKEYIQNNVDEMAIQASEIAALRAAKLSYEAVWEAAQESARAVEDDAE